MKLNKLIITGLTVAFLVPIATAKPAGKDKEKRPAKREFSKADADGDGKVSLAEFIDGAKDEDKATGRFKKKDKDSDGFLSEEEYAKGKKGKKDKRDKKKKNDE